MAISQLLGNYTAPTSKNYADLFFPSSSATSASYFLNLPTLDEVVNLIERADQVGMLKLIQTVATIDTLNCDEKISYLLEVLALVRVIIQEKISTAD